MRIVAAVFCLVFIPLGAALGQEQNDASTEQYRNDTGAAPAQNESISTATSADEASVSGDRVITPKPGESQTVQPGQPDEQITYTLGPDDIIDISVARHSEFSGVFPVNQEGKIQYKFIGDIDVSGYTKKELEARIRNIISGYVVQPQVDVTIVDFRSKVIYVIGEVGFPGKYYMRSETIPIREAVVQAGLPTVGAAMRKCRLISPGQPGKVKTRYVNIYSVLYGGNLRNNVEMKPGEILYVPSTIMAKIFKVVAPISAPIVSAADAQTGVTTLNTKPATTNQRIRY